MMMSNAAMRNAVEAEWLKHAQGSNRTFLPLEMGFPYRIGVVADEDSFLNEIWRKVEKSDVFCGVYDRVSSRNNLFDKIYTDLDFDKRPVSLMPAKKVFTYLEAQFHTTPRINYSGCRGWAIYIDFEKIKLKHPSALRMFVLNMRSMLHLDEEIVDTKVLGDKRRISRLPFTLNFRNTMLDEPRPPRLCIPIDIDSSLEDIEYASMHAEFPFRKVVEISQASHELVEELQRLDAEIEKEAAKVKTTTYQVFPEVAEEKLKQLMTIAGKFDNGRKKLMFHIIIPRLIEAGRTDAEISAFCKGFLERANAVYLDYVAYINRSIASTRRGEMGDGSRPFKAMSPETFIVRFPEMSKYFEREQEMSK